jgi:two-component system, cell cycle sensor histidine kinase and response regulator CckA
VDGRDALAVMERVGRRVNVVLLDLSMPRMGGQETLRRLRKRYAHLPIVMMSGYTEESVAAEFLLGESGATAFLQKPFLAEELVAVLRKVLEEVPASPD